MKSIHRVILVFAVAAISFTAGTASTRIVDNPGPYSPNGLINAVRSGEAAPGMRLDSIPMPKATAWRSQTNAQGEELFTAIYCSPGNIVLLDARSGVVREITVWNRGSTHPEIHLGKPVNGTNANTESSSTQ